MLGREEFRSGLLRPSIEALLAGQPTLGDWRGDLEHGPFALPVPNVWVGASIESDEYRWRADELRQAPAATRFLSLESLPGPLPSLQVTSID